MTLQTPYHIGLCRACSGESSGPGDEEAALLWGGCLMPLRIDWEGLIVAFESRSHQITHFFDRQTGDVEQVLVRDAERHAAFSADPRYLALPRDEGERRRGDLEEFLAQCEDSGCREKLATALRADDFAQAYRQALLAFPKEEARFFQFKEHRALERAQEWVTSMGLSLQKPGGERET